MPWSISKEGKTKHCQCFVLRVQSSKIVLIICHSRNSNAFQTTDYDPTDHVLILVCWVINLYFWIYFWTRNYCNLLMPCGMHSMVVGTCLQFGPLTANSQSIGVYVLRQQLIPILRGIAASKWRFISLRPKPLVLQLTSFWPDGKEGRRNRHVLHELHQSAY